MRGLVIGGSGFIGSHLVDALIQARLSVRIFDRIPEMFRAKPAAAEFLQGDFADTATLAKSLIGVDIVYHLLSTTVPGTSNLDPIADIEGNLVSSVRLLALMRDAGVKRIVYLSSGGTVYGIPRTVPVGEDHPLQPINSYGIIKSTIEQYIHMEHHLHGLVHTVLRASNPYGPRQGHGGVQGVIGTYLWNYAHGEPLRLWGDGSAVRDFIYVTDVADLCVRAGQTCETGCFNLGSGVGHSINDIIDTISFVVGEEIKPEIKPARGIDVPRSVLDITKAKAAFDWTPKTSLVEGVRRSWAWVQEQSR